MNLRIKKSSFFSGIYILMLCLNVGIKVLVSSNVSSIFFISKSSWDYLIPRASLFICLVLFIVQRVQTKRKLILMSIMSIAVLVTIIEVDTLTLAIIFLFIMSYPGTLQEGTVAKWISYTYIVSILYVLCLYFSGVINGYTVGRGEIIRYSSGFTSANGFANMVLYSLIAYIYYKRENWSMKQTVIWSVAVGYVYTTTNGRMSCLLALSLIVIMTLWHFRNRKSKKIYFLATVAFPICMAVSIIVTYLYDNNYFKQALIAFDVFTSFRLSYMVKYFNEPGISIFGQMVKTVTKAQSLVTGEKWSGLDNGYLFMLIFWGILGTSIYTFLVMSLGSYFKKKDNKYGPLCVIALCLIGLTENGMINVGTNLLVIMIAQMINERRHIQERNEISLRPNMFK